MMKLLKKLFKKLSLWVKNVVSRWRLGRYQNEFLDTVLFISHKLKERDRHMILALFSKNEVAQRTAEIAIMEFLNIWQEEES